MNQQNRNRYLKCRRVKNKVQLCKKLFKMCKNNNVGDGGLREILICQMFSINKSIQVIN